MSGSAIRRHKTPEEWRTLLERQERSGLSQREFCRREGISLSSFAQRRRESRNRDSAFVELSPPAESSPADRSATSDHKNPWSVEVHLPDGSVLRFHG